MGEKDLGITEVRGAKANIADLQVYGNGDTFAPLCKASSQEQGWMKSSKVCNVPGGCIVQATTQQRNPDGSYAVAEALTYVPGVHIDSESEPRKLVPISPEQDLIEGRIVHYVMPDGQHRPAVVVQVWNKDTGCSNLQVFTDGSNDGPDYRKGLFWATSVIYSENKEPSTWHWPERA